jgi:pSer/pThr/pTyr-binding forkhead associated (FHA) protein
VHAAAQELPLPVQRPVPRRPAVAYPPVVVAGVPHAATASELKAQIEAARGGQPFLVFRDGLGHHRIVVLDAATERYTVGRRSSATISLAWDEEVSRLHAELVAVGEDWTVVDDGLSVNGSFVNGEPIRGRRRLRDGDTLRFGSTVLVFRDPRQGESRATAASDRPLPATSLTEAQRRVLTALCRPYKHATGLTTPATNDQIARELFLTTDAVKKHLRTLFEKFEVEHLPQNQKRVRLVERAFSSGTISDGDL